MESLVKMCKAYLVSAGLFMMLSFTAALILSLTEISVSVGKIFVFAALMLCGFVFSVLTSEIVGKRGLLTGFAAGIVFVFSFLFLATTALNISFVQTFDNYYFVIPVVFSCVGGIVGANMKK